MAEYGQDVTPDATTSVADKVPDGTDVELYTIMTQALCQLGNRHWLYKRYSDYYNGWHRLVFATEKFRNAFGLLFREFADNLCPTVVGALSDRLNLTGFEVEEADDKGGDKIPKKGIGTPKPPLSAESDALQTLVKDLSEHSRLDRLANEVHAEALTCGDAFIVVWPDKEGVPRLYPQRAQNFTVCYDEEDPTVILWAAKAWKLHSGKFRLTVYLPDSTLKFITREKTDGLPEKPDKFEPFTPKDGTGPIVPNPYGKVPVFHFANDGCLGRNGRSELKDVLPLQDALNKSVLDMMVAMEFVALPQRWATGIELSINPQSGQPDQPFEPGVDRFWSVPNKDVKFGQYEGADLTGFMKAQDAFRVEVCRVSGTPLHYVSLQTGNPPSGEALEALEARLIKKAQDRHVAFGDTWEDVMQFACLVAGSANADLCAQWKDAAPRSEKEHSEALVNKQTLGVPQKQLWREMDYSDDQIEQFLDEKDEQAQQAADAALKMFDVGGGVPPQGGRGGAANRGPGGGGAAGGARPGSSPPRPSGGAPPTKPTAS